jgi:CubicO group peptidase (beta-lactamase class C family)
MSTSNRLGVFMRLLPGLLLTLLVFLSSVPPTAASDLSARLVESPEAFGQVLREWASKHKIGRAVVVVRRGGKIVYRASVGGADPDAAYPLASLSKAITGACIATLIRDGKLDFDTTVATALAKFMKTHGGPADKRLETATIAHLLTHRAGFSGADDAVVGQNLKAYLSRYSAREVPEPPLLVTVLRSKLLREPGMQHVYSNASYLMLGAIIEEATGESYERYCRHAVLKPIGVSGTLEPSWRVLWAFGGWRMTGADYLKFFETFDPAGNRLSASTKAWMLSSDGKDVGTVGVDEPWYALGTNVRRFGPGFNFWHWGLWHYNLSYSKAGPLSANFMAFAVRAFDGTAWFVATTPSAEDAARKELDRALWNARWAVKSWN